MTKRSDRQVEVETMYSRRLREIRERRGMSQREFGEILDMGMDAYRKHETRVPPTPPALYHFHKIKDVLGEGDANYILYGREL
jgi:transcriptional regulator with XRE-family HTH domain